MTNNAFYWDAIDEGMEKGRLQGLIEAYSKMVADGLITRDEAAKRAGVTEEEFNKLASELLPTGLRS